jgi:rhodanese-related sulfurtransferase
MRMIFPFALIWLLSAAQGAASQPAPQMMIQEGTRMQAIRTLDRADVKQGLANGSILLIDVREPHEYEAGHIPGAHSLPLSRFDAAQIPAVPGKEVVFVCRSGRRTLEAIRLAQEAGKPYTTHYGGSMLDWQQAGEPVEKGG